MVPYTPSSPRRDMERGVWAQKRIFVDMFNIECLYMPIQASRYGRG